MRSAGEPVIGAVVAALLAGPAALHAQAPAAARSEIVTYQNPVDGLPLSAQLFLPPGEGPFTGVVLLTLAGAGELIERLTDLGWAVLMSERRGIATIEHLLRASFDDLAIDVRAGADYLRHRSGPGTGSGHHDLHGGRSPRAEPRLPHRAPLPASYGSCQPPI